MAHTLLNRLATMEYQQLKMLCPFLYNGIYSNHQDIYLPKNIQIHNNVFYIETDGVSTIGHKLPWKHTLHFKNGFDERILFFDYLHGKYKIK